MLTYYSLYVSLIIVWIGWLFDLAVGDPAKMPHLVVGFGKLISATEHRCNRGNNRRLMGSFVAIILIILAYIIPQVIIQIASLEFTLVLSIFLVGHLLAGNTLIKEVREVFDCLKSSLPAGRAQLSRIVGRDTSDLTDEEVKIAALETLAENLSDGVIAPLFWLLVLGVPGMVAYKMINTLDSMIGYKNERYKDFGFLAAKIDDIANWIPARLTAILMLLAHGKVGHLREVFREGKKHTSPNSGYPEAALAVMLGCQFGGAHYYGGVLFPKPTIGSQSKILTDKDCRFALNTNRRSEVLMLLFMSLCLIFWNGFLL